MNQEINLTKSSSNDYSKILPIKKFVLYNICSLGLYQLYWIYKSWKNIKEHKNLNISPILRTIFTVFFIGSLAKDTLVMAKEKGYQKNYSYILIFVLFLILNIAGKKFPGIYSLIIALTSFLIFLPVVEASNYYWAKSEPSLKVNDKFSISNIVLLIIGGFFVLVATLSRFSPDEDNKAKTGVQLQDDSE